jgi:hypothetical protein
MESKAAPKSYTDALLGMKGVVIFLSKCFWIAERE